MMQTKTITNQDFQDALEKLLKEKGIRPQDYDLIRFNNPDRYEKGAWVSVRVWVSNARVKRGQK